MPQKPTSLVASRPTRGTSAPGGSPARSPPPAARTPAASPARAKRRSLLGRLLTLGLYAAVMGSLALTAIVVWAAYDLPRPESAMDAERRPALVLQDRAGQTFSTSGDLVGEPLRLADLPPELPEAVVAVEDHRFYHHSGIDIIGLSRALWVNLTHGHLVQGGSTITQQVAKTLFLTNERTLRRKIRELLLTIWLERSFSKNEILEIYLNRVYLGSGTWGVDAASRMYFGISARKLNLWQSAVLAGLPRAPSRFNPRANPQLATARAKEVLAAMVDTGVISQDRARAEEAKISFPRISREQGAWFADWASDQVQSVLPPNRDATVRTTLDERWQIVAEAQLNAILSGPGTAAGVDQGAIVVLDAATGAVRAMVGGRDYRDSNFNRAVNAHRQPGSAFKPFIWLMALENGMTPTDTVLDAPIRVGNWQPEDFEREYRGEITLDEALAHSVNTVSVRLLLKYGGPRPAAATAERLGITSKLPDDASLALGTGEVGLLELTAAYAPFFNGGFRVTPFAVTPQEAPEEVIRPEHAAMMAGMMQSVVNRGTGKAAALSGRVVAGKTGTTSDYRDAWFIGCVNGELIGVWMGNDDNTPMKNVVGGGLPARLFHDVAAAIR